MLHRSGPQVTGTASLYMLMGVMGGLGLDLCAKELLAHYPLAQFVFLRSLIGLGILLLLARQFGGMRSLFTHRWPWHLLRTVLAAIMMFSFFYGLTHLPLIDALTLGFTAPLIVTALSQPLLGEAVGWRRWLAVVVGFCGTLVVLRPGVASISLASIACLVAALCYALIAITARKLARTESNYALSVYVIIGPMVIALLVPGQSSWTAPDTAGWLLFAVAGACSVVAWIGFINAYRRAEPALLAPLEYLALVLGAAAGYLLWGEIPDRWVVAGSALIIAAGLFVVYREVGLSVLGPRRQPDQPPRPPLPEGPPPRC